MTFAGLPPVDRTQLPADIRQASPARQDAYTAALGFERLLVQQLTEQLAATSRDALGGDSPYASLLPDALADGVMSTGGLGLARQLADAIEPAATADADRAGGAVEDDSASLLAERLAPRQDPPATASEPAA